MVRVLTAGDTIEAQILLRARPLYNVFLDHVVSAGLLGRVPGFYGFFGADKLGAILMIGPLGGTVLEARAPDAYAPLAHVAARAPVRPRHIVGAEDVTVPFWSAYEPLAARACWSRREPFYVLERSDRARAIAQAGSVRIEPAREDDLDEVVANSAVQHREDLQDDRFALDPAGFRERHLKDLRDGRWWVTREERRISFQVHVGAENAATIQLGGVMTPPDLRNRGYATRGMAAICARLLGHKPAVSLFCDERNSAARRVYERVGFRSLFHYRSWLLDEPLPAAEQAAYL